MSGMDAVGDMVALLSKPAACESVVRSLLGERVLIWGMVFVTKLWGCCESFRFGSDKLEVLSLSRARVAGPIDV
jgi:hypothetical protein